MLRPASVTDILAEAFHGTPTEKRLKEGKIWMVWESSVGRQIATRARPMGFRDGTLTVAVSSAPWMQQLTFLKKGIMEKLNAQLGEEMVREIYLKAGTADPVKAEAPTEKRPVKPLSVKDLQMIAEKIDPVADPELRKALEELLQKHLETRQS